MDIRSVLVLWCNARLVLPRKVVNITITQCVVQRGPPVFPCFVFLMRWIKHGLLHHWMNRVGACTAWAGRLWGGKWGYVILKIWWHGGWCTHTHTHCGCFCTAQKVAGKDRCLLEVLCFCRRGTDLTLIICKLPVKEKWSVGSAVVGDGNRTAGLSVRICWVAVCWKWRRLWQTSASVFSLSKSLRVRWGCSHLSLCEPAWATTQRLYRISPVSWGLFPPHFF